MAAGGSEGALGDATHGIRVSAAPGPGPQAPGRTGPWNDHATRFVIPWSGT